MAKKTTESNWIKRFWKYYLYLLLFIPVFFLLVNFGVLGSMPDIEELENPRSALASELYSEDGEMLGQYFIQKRSYLGYDEIPVQMFDALISTEDERFYEHSGIDAQRLVGAVLRLGSSGGASTISQQLAKNLFHYDNGIRPNLFVRLTQKLKEWVIAVRLERRYTKEEIATMYLNTVQFSGISYGIKSAAKEFFNKEPKELKLEECAVLVGMLKAISAYNPKRNPNNSTARRNIVIGQMMRNWVNLRNKDLTKEDLEKLKATPIVLNYQYEDHNNGPAVYFREWLKKDLVKWCKEHKKPNGETYNLYKDGLKIYTTINYKLQVYAEEAAAKHLKDLQVQFDKSWGTKEPWRDENWKVLPNYPVQELRKTPRYAALKELYGKDTTKIMRVCRTKTKMTVFSWDGDKDTMMSPLDSVKYMKRFLHTGFIAIQPSTGQVKAWVGGINHHYFQYDHVNRSAGRQVGSTFKPFVYAMAIDNKISPCTQFPNSPPPYPNWRVSNSDGAYGGTMNMYKGLATSTNCIVAQVLYAMGENAPKNVVDFVRKMGIDSAKMDPYPSICLGVTDISPFDMAGAFSTFANKGYWIEPTYLTRIEDKNGNILAEFAPTNIKQIMTEEKAYVMCKLLEGVVNFGTGQRLRYKYGVEGWIGGKTGTTQSNSDGWFMGVTKDLVCATWVGCDSRKVRFRNTAYGQGAHAALPIFAYFIKRAKADPKLDIKLFPIDPPPNELSIEFRCNDFSIQGDVDEFGSPGGKDLDLGI
ncbi:MAG: transglycosylase domain-containing protein [Bacteroidia bacterium]|nr:transglycosylase domain-containing protein [Bacteroidia bacterium]